MEGWEKNGTVCILASASGAKILACWFDREEVQRPFSCDNVQKKKTRRRGAWRMLCRVTVTTQRETFLDWETNLTQISHMISRGKKKKERGFKGKERFREARNNP